MIQRLTGWEYFSPIGNELNQLKISLSWNQDNAPGQIFNMSSTIFEVSSLNDSVMTREKHRCSLLSHKNNNVSEYEIKKEVNTSSVPFVSGTLISEDPEKMATLDLNRKIKIWYIHQIKPIKSIDVGLNRKKLSDNWGAIMPLSRNCLAHVDRCCLNVFDLRTGQILPKLKFCPEPSLELCESITCVAQSQFDNLIYVGTTHSLLAIDIRQISSKTDNRSTVTNRWLHMLAMPPTMIETCLNRNGEEMIFIGNHMTRGGRTFIINRKIHNMEYYSPFMPRTVPSILDSYKFAQMHGKCLNPTSQMVPRLKYSSIGMAVTDDNSSTSLLTLNSIGDIHKQTIATDYRLKLEENIQSEMEAWMNELDKNESLPPTTKFTVTDLVSFKSLAVDLTTATDDSSILFENLPEQIGVTSKKPSWARSLKKLNTYKDVLAKDMLDLWNLGDGEGDPDEKTFDDKMHEKTNLVSNWLLSTTQNENSVVEDLTMSTMNDTLNESPRRIPPKAKRKKLNYSSKMGF